MWEGRPWAPEQIPGIDPNYTWGYPNPETHTYTQEYEYHNNQYLHRGRRLGYADGNFLWAKVAGEQAYATDEVTTEALDGKFAVILYLAGSRYYAERRLALVKRKGRDLFLCDDILISDDPYNNQMSGWGRPAVAAHMSNTRVAVAHYHTTAELPGTPTVVIVDRDGESLNVKSIHRVDRAHQDGPGGDNYDPSTCAAAINSSTLIVGFPDGSDGGTFGVPRFAVCSVAVDGSVASQSHSMPQQLGYPTADFFIGDYPIFDATRLNDGQAVYCVFVRDNVRYGNVITWMVGRMSVDGLSLTYELPHPVDSYVDGSIYSGAHDWLAPSLGRVSDDEIVACYTRYGNVAPHHIIDDQGAMTTLSPAHFGGDNSNRSYVAAMRRIKFVGSEVEYKAQHFLDISIPAFTYWRPGWGWTQAYGASWPKMTALSSKKFLAVNQRISYANDGLFNGVGLDEPGKWGPPFAVPLQSETNQELEATYGYPPERRNPGGIWSVVTVDESSPSGLRSEGASNSYVGAYWDAPLEGVPTAFGENAVVVAHGHYQGYSDAPTHPGFYDYIDEWYAYYASIGLTLSMPYVTYPDVPHNVKIFDPPRYAQRSVTLYHNSTLHTLPGPEHPYEESFGYYEWDPDFFAEAFGLDPGVDEMPYAGETVVSAMVVELKPRPRPIIGRPAVRSYGVF
jgi:hypothetical protein